MVSDKKSIKGYNPFSIDDFAEKFYNDHKEEIDKIPPEIFNAILKKTAEELSNKYYGLNGM